MKIGIQCPSWPIKDVANGISTYSSALKTGLEQQDCEVTILANCLSSRETSLELDIGFDQTPSMLNRVIRKFAPEYFNTIWPKQLFATLAKNQQCYNLDLVEFSDSFGWSKYFQEYTNSPVVVRLHGPWAIVGNAYKVPHDKQYKERVRREGQAISKAEGVTAPSENVLNLTREFYDLPLDNAVVIPNSTPVIPSQEKWNLSSCDRNKLLFVGRFDHVKGCDIAIDAFCKLKKEHTNLELVIIGPDTGIIDDSGREIFLHEYIEQTGLSELEKKSIIYLGRLTHSEIAHYRKGSFATILSSRYENFSLAALEALSYGCPLVASNSGGTPELLTHQDTGLLFDSESSEDLAKKLSYLLNNQNKASILGERAYQSIVDKFNLTVNAKLTKKYYESILSC